MKTASGIARVGLGIISSTRAIEKETGANVSLPGHILAGVFLVLTLYHF